MENYRVPLPPRKRRASSTSSPPGEPCVGVVLASGVHVAVPVEGDARSRIAWGSTRTLPSYRRDGLALNALRRRHKTD
jgi:hypothetical protein